MLKKLFRRKQKVVTQRNPMLDVPHAHNWLPANDGKELVCGECGLRQWIDGKEPKVYKNTSN